MKKSNNNRIEETNDNSNQTKECFEEKKDGNEIDEKQTEEEFVTNRKKIGDEFDSRSNRKSNDQWENNCNNSGSEYIPSDEENLTDDEDYENSRKGKVNSSTSVAKCKLASKVNRIVDDGDEEIYRERVRGTRRRKKEAMHRIDNLFKVPLAIWKNLYQYQRVSVQWLWELHNRNVGGLVGDEMGLGKTVQVIAFLAGLESSELLLDEGRFRGLGPTLIVCPATLLDQWVS